MQNLSSFFFFKRREEKDGDVRRKESAHTPRKMAMLESFFFDSAVSSVAGFDCMAISGTSVCE